MKLVLFKSAEDAAVYINQKHTEPYKIVIDTSLEMPDKSYYQVEEEHMGSFKQFIRSLIPDTLKYLADL